MTEIRRSMLAFGAATLAAGAWCGTAAAQCDVTPDPGAQTQNDACGSSEAGYVDPNGGCNVAGNPTQDLGLLTAASPTVQVVGTVGNFVPSGATEPTTRDLDWFSFELEEPGTVDFSITNNDGTGINVPIVVFVIEGFDCDTSTTLIGVQTSDCPYVASVSLPEGVHKLIVTVPFFGDGGALCSVDYRATATFQPGLFPNCGSADAGSCIEPHPTGGCDNFTCCEAVCQFEPFCCDVEWDQVCVDYALSPDLGCGYFAYTCDSPAGAPANDCATDPTVAEIGDVFTFSNVNASTDGPNGDSSVCTAGIGNDLWWLVQSPGSGYLTATMCNGTDFDTVIDVYALGDSPDFDPALLPDLQLGCVDDTCGTVAGPEIVTIIDAEEGQWFLFRAGGWVDPETGLPSTGNGEIAFEFLNVVYNTGGTRALDNAGTLTNLGLSSGNLNASFPQRWVAMPFTVPAPAAKGADSWLVETIAANGFTPAGVVNETLNWIVWSRDAATNAAPVDGDQVATGSVPFPTPIDDPTGDPANEQHDITTEFVLAPGDYYLTVYADNASGGATPSNFAWFINAPDGIELIDAEGVYAWRSAFQPDPGFQRYTLPDNFQQQAGLDPNELYNAGFKILGVPYSSGKPPVVGDLNGDGVVNGADLTILLGCWGEITDPACSPADIADPPDGTINGADLTTMLSNWTA
jgi:hypothetical protein